MGPENGLRVCYKGCSVETPNLPKGNLLFAKVYGWHLRCLGYFYLYLSTECPRKSTVDTASPGSRIGRMDTWAPLFSKIVESSLWSEDDLVVKVFITMLAKKDSDHCVRASAYMIGTWARKTEKEVLGALKVLSSPDRKRLEPQPHEGRRIKKVDGGWLILNGQVYEDLMREVNRRVYKAKKQREYREAAKPKGPQAGEMAYVNAEKNGASQEVLDKLSEPQA